VPEVVRRSLLARVLEPYRDDVEFPGPGPVEQLGREFAAATVSVLPSLWESFGMVLVESLACGTPVVGCRHGAIPELIRGGVGTLFDPGEIDGARATNAPGLCDALDAALDLAGDPQTSGRCRAYAESFGWDVVGPRYEALYERLVSPAALQPRLHASLGGG
jgi:phosphatidyl-myo-inositol alpha-mannosyltransferase